MAICQYSRGGIEIDNLLSTKEMCQVMQCPIGIMYVNYSNYLPG